MQHTSLPEAFIGRVQLLYPDTHEEILNTFNTPRPPTFRINTLKASADSVLSALSELGFECEETPIPDAFVLRSKTQRELTDTDVYREGQIYIQGLSSMIPSLVLGAQENELVLDACAAPGSKTTQIAATMSNTGQIIANDMSRVRLYKLAANIQTLGVQNIKTVHMRAQDLWRKFPNTFDRVLADVPCSLEGRFLTQNPKTFAQWSEKKIKIISEHQKHILRSAISCAKPGATIIYSTCTLSPEENEEVVDWILKKDSTVELQQININGIPFSPAVTEWKGKEYAADVSLCKRITPTPLFEGFFIAQFIKR